MLLTFPYSESSVLSYRNKASLLSRENCDAVSKERKKEKMLLKVSFLLEQGEREVRACVN